MLVNQTELLSSVQFGDLVTVIVPINMRVDWVTKRWVCDTIRKTGRAYIQSPDGTWILDVDGIPTLANAENTISVKT